MKKTNNPEQFIDIAISEAKKSLQSGNSGFGAVVVQDDVLLSKAHDTDKTSKDPTAHAEITAIQQAAVKVDGNFKNCMLISTHEPCPMCATAIVWSGIKKIAFGYSIQDALSQGRKRIDLSCDEVFQRAGASIEIIRHFHQKECGLLYNEQIRKSIKQLRNADVTKLKQLAQRLSEKRLSWFHAQMVQPDKSDPLTAAYQLFLKKLGISEYEAPIVNKQTNRLVIHSKNFCPTLEACKILDLDTRFVCQHLNEAPTQDLLQQIHPRLRFKRNYKKLRPYSPYCEEMIFMDDAH